MTTMTPSISQILKLIFHDLNPRDRGPPLPLRPASNNVIPKSEDSLEVLCAHGLLDPYPRTHETAALRTWKVERQHRS